MSNCPVGAEYAYNAPYNEVSKPEIKIDATVSVTLYKQVSVPLTNYNIDEEGDLEYSEHDLKQAVENHILYDCNYKDWKVCDVEIEEL